MSAPDYFPVVIPDPLPQRIDPCPIIDAVLEVRFTTDESWGVLPGLLFSRIRERYPEMQDLPASKIPEEVRRQQEVFTYQPLSRFLGTDFMVQFGPRMVSLNAKPGPYPGWPRIRGELKWLLDQVRAAGFVREGERIGVRYIDFFPSNLFLNLSIETRLGDQPLHQGELTLATVFRRAPFTARLLITNSAVVRQGDSTRVGSILDLDVWIGSLDFSLFEDGLDRFDEAHHLLKGTFFGLLRSDYLRTLNPVYP